MSVNDWNSSKPGARDDDLDRAELGAHLRHRVVDGGAVGDVDRDAERVRRPAPAARRRRAAAASPSRSSSATRCPCAARRWPTARPMPDAAPVTTATRLIVFPLGRAASERVWPDPGSVRKQALEKRECHCHSGRRSLGSAATPRRRKGTAVRIGLMIGPERGRYRDKVAQARRRRRGGRAGRLHLDLGAPGPGRLRRAHRDRAHGQRDDRGSSSAPR